jgi:hypothetical protein
MFGNYPAILNISKTSLLPFNGDFSFGKARSRGEPNLGWRWADRNRWWDEWPGKNLNESCRMGRRIIVMKLICSLGYCGFQRSDSTQAQSTVSHCRLTSPTWEWLFTVTEQGLFWLAAKLHQGHANGSRDIQNGRILSGQPSSNTLKWIRDLMEHLIRQHMRN